MKLNELWSDLIKAQIKIAQIKFLERTTISFPNSERVKDEDIEVLLKKLCPESKILAKQTITTVGSCSVSLWTIKI